jgi:small subunit ribosomal protein S15
MDAKVAVFLQKIIVFTKVLSIFVPLFDSTYNNNSFFMYLNPEKKQEIFGKYGKSNTDTGSPESQIALFSYRINHLTEHLKSNHKDHSTEHALRIIIGKRRRLLDYLKEKDIEKYRSLIKDLSIRR